jgi:hypothetical protein
MRAVRVHPRTCLCRGRSLSHPLMNETPKSNDVSCEIIESDTEIENRRHQHHFTTNTMLKCLIYFQIVRFYEILEKSWTKIVGHTCQITFVKFRRASNKMLAVIGERLCESTNREDPNMEGPMPVTHKSILHLERPACTRVASHAGEFDAL